MDQTNGMYPEGAHHIPTENVPATAYPDSVLVSTQQMLPTEMWEMIYDKLDERQKAAFSQTSRLFNDLAHNNANIKLSTKFTRLFGDNHSLIDQMRFQFTEFLSMNGISPSYREQLYWFDFILFLNDGQNISCDGVELRRNTNGALIFEISKTLDGIRRKVVKLRISDTLNRTTYYINGLESREDGPSMVVTNRADGKVEEEMYKRGGHFRPPSEGPGLITFSDGRKSFARYYINDIQASDGSAPDFVSWHKNGNMYMRTYCKADNSYVDEEMTVKEVWLLDGTKSCIVQNMLFDGRYWLNRSITLNKDGSIRTEAYKRMGPSGSYVLHREDGPAVITYHAGGGVTTQFWLDGHRQ